MANQEKANQEKLTTRALLVVVLAAALVSPVNPAGAASSPTATYTNPVFDDVAADPFVLRHDGTFYAYATNADHTEGPGGVSNVPVLRSDDLAHWKSAADALPTANLGAWVDTSKLPGPIWAPSVLERWYGRPYWVLYYTAPSVEGGQCIGVAVATHPAGPFRDDRSEPFICQRAKFGSIDASPFLEPGGAGRNAPALLTWKSENNVGRQDTEIWAQRVEPSGLALAPGGPRLLLTGDRSVAFEVPSYDPTYALVEGPSIVPDERGRRYFLFYSSGWILGTAAIGYAVCDNLDGLPADCRRPKSAAAPPWMGEAVNGRGPGGQELFRDDDGQLWMAYHARREGSLARTLRLDKVCFRSPRRPETNGPTVDVAVPLARGQGCARDVPG